MKVLQSSLFAKTVKKLHKPEKELLDDAVKALLVEPELGDLKTGDLNGVRVYKFKVNTPECNILWQLEHKQTHLSISSTILCVAYPFLTNSETPLSLLSGLI